MKETVLQNQKFIDDIICIENEDGKLCKNTFEIGLQAIIGESVLSEYKERGYIGLIPRIFDINHLNHKPDKYSKKAIEYLENTYMVRADSYTWVNDYEVYFRGEKTLDKNWVCAFGQSYILMAFIWWYKITNDAKYLKFAIKTAKFYTIELKDGGIKNYIKKNGSEFIFFEELPSSKPTHILNAFLISLVALKNLSTICNEDWLSELIRESTISLENLLPSYDIGNWSRYDIPNDLNTIFQVGIDGIHEVFIGESTFKFGNQTILINNKTDFDTSKSEYLSGIEWGMDENIDGVFSRKLINGKNIRNHAVNGGTIQNSYINITLSDIEQLLLDDETIEVTLKIFSSAEGTFYLNTQDYSDNQFAFNNEFSSQVSIGWNVITAKIPIRKLSNMLSDEYHSFHTDLLNILAKNSMSEIFNTYFNKFLSYKHNKEFSKSYLPYIEEFSEDKELEMAFISVNSVCGLNCIMCDIGIKDTDSSLYKHLKSDTKYNMTTGAFEIITDKLKNKVKTIAFIGTEALFNKNIYEFIKIAKDKGFYVTLTTNGIKLYDNNQKLIDAGLDEVWLSIDGVKEKHDNIRGQKGLFDKFESGIKQLCDIKKENNIENPKIYISSTILPSVNETEILQFIKYFNKYKIDGFSLNHMNYVTEQIAMKHNSAFPSLPITKSKYLGNFNFKNVDYLKFYDEINQVKTYAALQNKGVSFVPELKTYQNLVDYYLFPKVKIGKKTCTAAWSTIEVDPKGQMSIAARCFQIDMGNIIKEEFNDIWMGSRYKDFRNKLLDNESFLPCHRCCGAL